MAHNQLDRHNFSQSTLRTQSVWSDALGRDGGMYTNFFYSSIKGIGKETDVTPVSYTHLTLPTICSV